MPTIADFEVTITIPGSYLTWYDDALMTNPPLNEATLLVDGMSYFVSQTATEGCESALAEVVAVITLTPDAPHGDAIQEFCVSDYATVADLIAIPDEPNTLITWYDAAGNQLLATDLLEDGVSYFATQTSYEAPHCESVAQFEVLVVLEEVMMPSGEFTQEFCAGDMPTVADLIVYYDSEAIVVWYDTPEGGTPYTSTDPLEEGMYYAEAISDIGCISERFAVEVVFDPEECGSIPDAFTPNHDDLNPVWKIPILYHYPNFKLEVYDRWGNLVYDYDNAGAMEPTWWDGYSTGRLNFQDGKPLPSGTYFYLIDFNDGKKQPVTGWVFLSR